STRSTAPWGSIRACVGKPSVTQQAGFQDPQERSPSSLSRRLLDRVPNKRKLLARSFEWLGLLNLLERAALCPQPTLAVLTYHRIAPPGAQAGPFYDPVISATPETFKTQMRFLARRYRIIGLDEVVKLEANEARNIRSPAVLVTFDDGYRDNFEAALP